MEHGDLRVHRDVFAEELHGLRAVFQLPAERPLRLIAYEQDDVFLAPQVVFQMVADSARLAHAAGGEYDLGLGVGIDELGFVGGNGQLQSVKPDGVDALFQNGLRLVVKVRGVALQENSRRFHGQRGVHVHREMVVSRHQTPLLDLPDGVEHFLRPPHGKGGDDQIAAPVQRPLDAGGQLAHHVAPLLGMQAVAVGGFDDQIFRLRNRLGVAEQGLIDVAHVAAEHDLPGLLPLRQPHFDGGGTQQMADVRHADDNALRGLNGGVILAGAEQPESRRRVVGVVYRLHGPFPGALGLAGAPLGFRFLNVRRVHQHDAAKIAGGLRGVDLPPEPVLAQLGEHTGMVDMGVGQEHRFDGVRRNGQRDILENVLPLLHTAVHQIVSAVHFQQRTAASDLMGRADELNFHVCTSKIHVMPRETGGFFDHTIPQFAAQRKALTFLDTRTRPTLCRIGRVLGLNTRLA